MPSAANIVLADAQATPVNHTFTPIGLDKDNTYWYEDASAPATIGNWRISVKIARPAQPMAGQNSNERVYRIRIGLHVAVLANVSNSTVTGVAPLPTLAYIPRTFVEHVIPEAAVKLDRDNLNKMVPNLLLNAQIMAVLQNLESIRG